MHLCLDIYNLCFATNLLFDIMQLCLYTCAGFVLTRVCLNDKICSPCLRKSLVSNSTTSNFSLVGDMLKSL